MSLFRIAAGIVAGLALAGAARAEPLRTPRVETELVSSRSTIAPGERFTVAVRQRIIPGWHTYWRNPGDSGEPIVVTWRLPAGFEAGELRHPPPETEQVLDVMTYVHKGEVLFPIELRAPEGLRPGGTVALSAHVFYLVCSDICLTEEGDVSASLPVDAASQSDPAWARPIAAAEASIPRNEAWEARVTAGQPARLTVASGRLSVAAREGRLRNLGFFPFSPDEVRHVVPQLPSYGPGGVSFSLAPGVKDNLGRADLAGVVAFDEKTVNGWVRRGVEIAAKPGEALQGAAGTSMPDAAPARSAGAGRASAPDSGFTLPMALLFALLGGLILNVMPCVLPVLAIKAVGLAQNAHGSARRGGLFYLAGVLATFLALAGLLIALRSAGGALGWAFHLQEPWLVSGLALLFFAIGLNLLGAFEIGGAGNLGSSLAARGGDAGAFFTGALAVVVASPCTAPFMASATGFALASSPAVTFAIFAALAIGFALPLTLLSFAPGLQRLIPKPGAWMERFKQFLAFPMFGAAVWLAWVLTVQQGAMGTLALLSIAVAVAFVLVAWRWGRIWGAIALASLVGVGVLALRPLTVPVQAAAAPSRSAELQTEPWSSERVEALRAENRPILVNFTAAWCVTCKVNEASSLRSPRVAQAFRESNVAYLKGDWTSRDSAIAAELQRHGRAGVPLYLYYAPGAETPRILPQLLTESLLLQIVEPST